MSAGGRFRASRARLTDRCRSSLGGSLHTSPKQKPAAKSAADIIAEALKRKFANVAESRLSLAAAAATRARPGPAADARA